MHCAGCCWTHFYSVQFACYNLSLRQVCSQGHSSVHASGMVIVVLTLLEANCYAYCNAAGSQVCNLSWSKNVNEIVSTHGYSQNQIIVWKHPTMTKLATLTGHTLRVLYLAVSPDGQTIVTGAGQSNLVLPFMHFTLLYTGLHLGSVAQRDVSSLVAHRGVFRFIAYRAFGKQAHRSMKFWGFINGPPCVLR